MKKSPIAFLFTMFPLTGFSQFATFNFSAVVEDSPLQVFEGFAQASLTGIVTMDFTTTPTVGSGGFVLNDWSLVLQPLTPSASAPVVHFAPGETADSGVFSIDYLNDQYTLVLQEDVSDTDIHGQSRILVQVVWPSEINYGNFGSSTQLGTLITNDFSRQAGTASSSLIQFTVSSIPADLNNAGLTPVPEPATTAFAIGLAALTGTMLLRRRNRR